MNQLRRWLGLGTMAASSLCLLAGCGGGTQTDDVRDFSRLVGRWSAESIRINEFQTFCPGRIRLQGQEIECGAPETLTFFQDGTYVFEASFDGRFEIDRGFARLAGDRLELVSDEGGTAAFIVQVSRYDDYLSLISIVDGQRLTKNFVPLR